MLSRHHPQDIIVIERDFTLYKTARALNFRAVWGDATDIKTLRVAQVGIAGHVVVCVGDLNGPKVVQTIRELTRSARVRAGASVPQYRNALKAAGADDVVVLSDVAGVLLARSLQS